MNNRLCRSVLGLVAVGIIANTARAVNVDPPSPVPALSPTTITVSFTASDKSFILIIGVVDGKMYLPNVKDAGPGKLTFSGPPGTYAVMGMEDGKRIQQTIVVEGDDGPDPQPPPPPTPGKRTVVIVRESAEDNASFALVAQKLQQYAKTKGHKYRLVDDDQTLPNGQKPAWLTEYLAKAATAKIQEPFLAIVSSVDGVDNVTIVPLPLDADAAIRKIQELGG